MGFLILLVHVFCTVFSGILAYNWVNPHSFVKIIFFLIVWGLIERVVSFLLILILQALLGNSK